MGLADLADRAGDETLSDAEAALAQRACAEAVRALSEAPRVEDVRAGGAARAVGRQRVQAHGAGVDLGQLSGRRPREEHGQPKLRPQVGPAAAPRHLHGNRGARVPATS